MTNITNLPSEIVVSILCELPVRSIIMCKYVRKSWLDLIQSREFVNHHLHISESVIMMVFRLSTPASYSSRQRKLLEMFEHKGSHNRIYYNVLNLPRTTTHGQVCSTRGLFLYRASRCLVLSNPITRDSLELELPPHIRLLFYGLGVSQVTGQHKVVTVVLRTGHFVPECYVYTPESRSPRRIEATPHDWAWKTYPAIRVEVTPRNWEWGTCYDSGGVYVNGKLHWLVIGPQRKPMISSFDLETEIFTNFPTPPPSTASLLPLRMSLFASEDRLGFCDYSGVNKTVLWLMKDMKSWSKELEWCAKLHQVIRIFEDGDILMKSKCRFCYYSKKTNSMKTVDIQNDYFYAFAHTPTVLSPVAALSPLH